MKNIIIFHHCGDIGGAGISLINTAAMLSDKYHVTVYAQHGPIVDLMKDKGITVKTYKNPCGAISSYSGGPLLHTRTYLKTCLAIRKSYREISDIVKSEEPDIVITNSITTSYICKIAKRYGIKTVSFIRETRRNDIGNHINERLLARYADRIIYLSKYDQETYKIKPNAESIICNSISLTDYQLQESREEACHKLGVDPKLFHALYLGGDSELKGWEVMKKLIATNIENVSYVIAGSCQDDSIASLNGAVKYIGIQKNISDCMKCADVLLFPIKHPHQGRPIFEAGLFETPVIVPKFEVFQEAVIENYNGLYFQPDDVNDLQAKIKSLEQEPERARVMGINNQKMTMEKHLFEINKERMLKVFAELFS